MGFDRVVSLASEALMLCVLLSLPAVLVSAVVGLAVSFFQAVTSLQDQSISQGIKLLAVALTVGLSAPWAGTTLAQFADSVFASIFSP